MAKLPRKSIVVSVWKLLLVPAVIWFMCREVGDRYSLGSLDVNFPLIALALLVNQMALSLFALRMKMVLGIFGIPISGLQSLRIHLQSIFYYFIFPMTIGLEAARFAKIKAIVGNQGDAFALGGGLVADRLVGAVAALLTSIVLIPFMEPQVVRSWEVNPTFVMLASLGGLLLLALIYPKTRFHLGEVVGLLRRGRRVLWLSMLASLLTNLVFAFGVYLGAMAANLDISFAQTLFVISASMLFVVIPVSLAGASPVEAASMGVLLGIEIPMDQAIVFVVISYVAKLIAAFEGGGWEIYEGLAHLARGLIGPGRQRPGGQRE